MPDGEKDVKNVRKQSMQKNRNIVEKIRRKSMPKNRNIVKKIRRKSIPKNKKHIEKARNKHKKEIFIHWYRKYPVTPQNIS